MKVLKDFLGKELKVGDRCIRCASLNDTNFSMCKVVGFKEKKYRGGKELLVEILSDGSSKTGRTYPERLVILENL